MSSFPEVAIETGHHVCGNCRLPVAGPDVVMLLCNHYLCVECVEHLSQQMNRRWCLPCQRLGCQAKFALPLAPHSLCSPTPTVHQQCVPDRYAEHVALIGVLDGGSKIRGLALLENALYVASNKNYLLKFDVPDGFERAPVRHEPQQLAAGIKWPRGVAVCQKYATVYVVDWSKLFGGSMWVIRENETSSSTVDIDFQPFGVSASETAAADDGGARIFVSCATPAVGNPTIVVYADDGDVVRKVAALRLPSDFEIPRHVVRLPNIFVDEFAVCHGWTRLRNHRVSIVRKAAGSDVRLEETSAYGTGSGDDQQQLRCPLSICVDEDGMILIADCYNNRIQLLTSRLQLVRHLVTKREHGLEYPRHVCIDEKQGLLFVGQHDGHVYVFKIRN